MNDFKSSYAGMLATLYGEIEALLAEFGDPATLSPSACEAMWSKFQALRDRFAVLRHDADRQLAQGGPAAGEDLAVHTFLYELERLLDVDHEGDDWEAYVGAAMMQVENRICDEARRVERGF
ncbi:MAG TPA: hypothetical protein VF055_02440 [Steroidobacteraceae bacterium]